MVTVADTAAVVPLYEDMAERCRARIDEAEAVLDSLRGQRRQVARWLLDAGYSRARVAELLGLSLNGLAKTLKAGEQGTEGSE